MVRFLAAKTIGEGAFRCLSAAMQERFIAEYDRALRALRAAGVVMVPAEPTYAMQEAAAFCDSDRWPTVIRAMLSAGQIKPEGE